MHAVRRADRIEAAQIPTTMDSLRELDCQGECRVMTKKTAKKRPMKPGSVDEYVDGLEEPRRKEVQAVRRIILGVNPKITEEIKWNAPSFALGEHFVTFNAWSTDEVQLIFHHGPKKATSKGVPIDDPDGLLEWLATDRASMKLHGMKDIQAKKSALQSLVRAWIKAMKPAAGADAERRRSKGG